MNIWFLSKITQKILNCQSEYLVWSILSNIYAFISQKSMKGGLWNLTFCVSTTWIVLQVDCSGGGQFKSMGLENTVSAFALVATAVVVALIVLLWELVRGLRKPRLADPSKAKEHYQASSTRPLPRDTTPIPSDWKCELTKYHHC